MKVIKKLNPGAPGTKRHTELFGENLLCVRYRYDPSTQQKLTTVEIIVDTQKQPHPSPTKSYYQHPRSVYVRVNWDEQQLQEKMRNNGGYWDKQKKRWRLSYQIVVKLGLTDRIENVVE